MTDPVKSTHAASNLGPEPALALARSKTGDAPPGLASLRAVLDQHKAEQSTFPVLTDAEHVQLIQSAIQELGLPTDDIKAPVQALTLGAPGSTVKVGFDQKGTINVFNALQVYRADTTGSYLHLQANELAADKYAAASFHVDLDLAQYAGIYLAVFTVDTNLAQINVDGWLYPNGWFRVSATPSNGKILVPFEITNYAYLLSLSFLIHQAAADQHLYIYEGLITKVT